MVQKGFEETAKKADLDRLESRVKEIEAKMNEGFNKVDTRLYNLERDVSDIKTKLTHLELENLPERVAYIERKLGIKSRK